MKKITPYIGILVIILGFLTPVHAHALLGIEISDMIGDFLSPIGYAIMGLTSLLTALAGLLLNASVYHTIIQMADTFKEVTAINTAWTVLRDLANMVFIFVILYASILLIVGKGKDTQRLIVNMVMAAILINFSLFFTKVIIDVANLLAITFYSALAPGSLDQFATAGMANAIMDSLKLTSLYDLQTTPLVNGANIFTISIMSSIVFLISAFVFFAISILLIIRYVVLIFVLILSPLMFVSMILPQLDKYRKQWWNALMGQAFFAPIYFLLTWVTVVVIRGLSEATFEASGSFADALTGASGSIPIIINFLVIIAFLIISLVIAKNISNQAGDQVKGLTKWAMGTAGGATFGMAGRVGRGTLGAAGSAIADSERLKKMDEKGGFAGAAARLSLAAGRKSSKATFDARGSSLYEKVSESTGTSFGKAGGKGGFEQTVKDIAKREKERADALKPSDLVVNKAENELKEAKKGTDEARIAAAQTEVDQLKGVSEDDARKKKINEIRIKAAEKGEIINEKEAKRRLGDLESIRFAKIAQLKKDQNMSEDEAKEAAGKLSEEEGGWAVPKEIKGAGVRRKEAYAERLLNPNLKDFNFVKNSKLLNKVMFVSKGNKQAAMEIRKSIKEKKPSDKLAEELSKAKEAGEDSSSAPQSGSTPPASPPSPGPQTP